MYHNDVTKPDNLDAETRQDRIELMQQAGPVSRFMAKRGGQ